MKLKLEFDTDNLTNEYINELADSLREFLARHQPKRYTCSTSVFLDFIKEQNDEIKKLKEKLDEQKG